MRNRIKITSILLAFCFCCSSLHAIQSQSTVFSTPDDLKKWINTLDDEIPVSIQTLQDKSGSFIRISPATNILIGRPGLRQKANSPDDLSALMNPATQNTIKVRLRHTTAFHSLSGFWLHRTTAVDGESFSQVPCFDARPLPPDGLWHEVTFPFSDSPFVDLHSEVVVVYFLFYHPCRPDLGPYELLLRQTAATAYIDIAQITLLFVPQALPQPIISSFTPARARYRNSVVLTGSGFAQPAERNVVFFGSHRATVLSGNATSLVVEAESDGPITVRVPGGGIATSTASFTLLGPPKSLVKVRGDQQSGASGTVLQAIVVRVADTDGNGLPGETITFRIKSGAGLLSSASATTDDSGVASTVLTLPASPGQVQVEAVHSELFSTIVFTAVATAH